MKKELFYEVINLMQNEPDFNRGPCAIRETDEIISYSFDSTNEQTRDHMEVVKDYCTENGYKYSDTLFNLIHNRSAYKEYHTVLYNKLKDRVSLGRFTVGYAWSDKKQRVYPYRVKEPILCYSKQLYHFWHKNKPRVLTSTWPNRCGLYHKIIDRIFLKVGYTSHLRISYRHFIGTNNEWEAMENYFGRPIPQELRRILPENVFTLYTEFFGTRSRRYTLEAQLNIRKLIDVPATINTFSL